MPVVQGYKIKNMISNPNRYTTKRSPVLLIEEKLNSIYQLVLELEQNYELKDSISYDLESIKETIQNLHEYFTNTLKNIAIENKKYNLND